MAAYSTLMRTSEGPGARVGNWIADMTPFAVFAIAVWVEMFKTKNCCLHILRLIAFVISKHGDQL